MWLIIDRDNEICSEPIEDLFEAEEMANEWNILGDNYQVVSEDHLLYLH